MNSLESPEEIRSALSSIDAGDRDVWIRMGFAVYSEFGASGFEIWDDWSRTWPDYRERDARAAWRSFRHGGGRQRVTIGSLFHLARERGWLPPENGAPPRRAAPPSDERAGRTPDAAKQGPLRGSVMSSKRREEPSEAERRAYAARVWADAMPIPQAASHPARRWLEARKLWWPGVPLPAAVRFVERLAEGWPYRGRRPSTAAVVGIMAQPEAWIAAWPELPEPAAAVLCVFINADGGKAFPYGDDGRDKMTLGVAAGGVVVLGSPAPSGDGLGIVEGLADGLGRAARHWETTICTATTPHEEGAVSDYAASWQRVAVLSDNDDAGDKTGFKLLTHLLERGGDVERLVYAGFKDPAEAFAAGVEPLADVQGRRDDVLDMADDWERDGLPRWEAVRRASLCIGDEDGDTDGLDTIEGEPPDADGGSDGGADGPPIQGQLIPTGTEH